MVIKTRYSPLLFVLLGCGVLAIPACNTHHASRPPTDAELRGIQKLHQQDIAATLSGMPDALANLFTKDAVLLEPGSPPVIGKAAILAENIREKAARPQARVLSYKPEIKDIQVFGDAAFEWTYFKTSFQESEQGEVKSFQGRALRVIKREPDGSWKFTRVMWNLGEEASTQ